MDVLLVSANPRKSMMNLIGVEFPNVGLGILAAILEKEDFRVSIKHTTYIKDFCIALKENSPSIVGISCTSSTYLGALRMAKITKEYDKDIAVVLGGPHVTFLDREAFYESQEIDVVVRGEGERSFLNLAKHYLRGKPKLQEISNITYRHDKEVLRNPLEPLLSDLDEVPFQAYHLYDKGRRPRSGMYGTKVAGIVTSRGCPFRCTFCTASAMYGHVWRARSAKNVVDEIQYLTERFKIKWFGIADDNFCASPTRLEEFCRELRERKLDVRYLAFARADFVTGYPGLLKEMREAGLRCIVLGVESGSQEVLNKYDKKLKLKVIDKAFEITKENGLIAVGTFMIGSDWETVEDIRKTIEFAIHLNPHFATMTIFTPYPGTKDYERIKSEGRLLAKDWSQYDGEHIVYWPQKISPEQVFYCYNKAIKEFYGRINYWLQNVRVPNFAMLPNVAYWLVRRKWK